jgi:membrane-bound ClpP family serine protease
MSQELIWPILCLAAGLILLIAEVFIPSGGVIGFLAVGFLALSVWLAFANTMHGWKFLLALFVLLPLTLMLAVYLWPRSPLAKYLFLKPPAPEDVVPEPTGPLLDHLVGQFGRALTPLRPSGMVDFEGRRIDGISEEGLIPAGSLVRAVQVRAGKLIVRLANDHSFDEILT